MLMKLLSIQVNVTEEMTFNINDKLIHIIQDFRNDKSVRYGLVFMNLIVMDVVMFKDIKAIWMLTI